MILFSMFVTSIVGTLRESKYLEETCLSNVLFVSCVKSANRIRLLWRTMACTVYLEANRALL